MKRKFLAALLALVMVFSMIPVSASAAEVSVPSNNGYFNLSYNRLYADSQITVNLISPSSQQAHALHPGDAQHLPDGQSFGADDVLSPPGPLAVGLGPDRQSEEHQGRDAQLDAQRHPVAAPPPAGPLMTRERM